MADVRKIKSLEEFQEFINTPDSLNVVKIGAPWCGPCRILEKTLHELNEIEVDGVLLAEINADEEWFEDLGNELKVRGIPVLFAYKNGEMKNRIQGTLTRKQIVDFFEENK